VTPVQVVNLSYIEFDPTVDDEARLDTRARFVLGADGRVRIYTRTQNFRDHVLPELIGGPGGAQMGGREFLETLRQLIHGTTLTTSEIIEMDEAEAREGFPYEFETG
jgi:hypothetical protein